MVRIPRAIFQEMVEHARSAWPVECCGLLAGRDDLVTRIYRLENRDRSRTTYFACPEGELQALTEMDDLDLDLVAIYHSHPDTESYPSATDIEKAYFTEPLYIIISLKESSPRVRAFRISRAGEVSEEEFETI